MKLLIIMFGIMLFAFVTAILVLWGMRKAYFQRETIEPVAEGRNIYHKKE